MKQYNHQQWMKYMRRNEANVFNAIFSDKEEVTEDDIQRIIADVASFGKFKPNRSLGFLCVVWQREIL